MNTDHFVLHMQIAKKCLLWDLFIAAVVLFLLFILKQRVEEQSAAAVSSSLATAHFELKLTL